MIEGESASKLLSPNVPIRKEEQGNAFRLAQGNQYGTRKGQAHLASISAGAKIDHVTPR
jgi:hypothetical protein